ncbi:MAG TPA: hypothetical protein VF420_07925, partial [Casimicrobiaceae bacterium]
VAAIASASMQFVDLEPAFATLARVISPGGHFAFNLWWHHWEDTATVERGTGWIPVARAACLEAQLPPPEKPAAPPVNTRSELMSASTRHGFKLLAEHCDEDKYPVAHGVAFYAMDADWPVKGCAPEVRRVLLDKMHALAQGRFETLVSTRFLFQKAA